MDDKPTPVAAVQAKVPTGDQIKPKKEGKKAKEPKKAAAKPAPDQVVDVSRLDMRVAFIR